MSFYGNSLAGEALDVYAVAHLQVTDPVKVCIQSLQCTHELITLS